MYYSAELAQCSELANLPGYAIVQIVCFGFLGKEHKLIAHAQVLAADMKSFVEERFAVENYDNTASEGVAVAAYCAHRSLQSYLQLAFC